MYVKRKIEDDILKYLVRKEILAIVGPRQCGKTTVMKKIFSAQKDAVFLTFEDQEILALFEKNIKQFIATYVIGRKFLFIDEFQYAHNGGKLLKYIYDTQPIKIIISGSSAIDLTVKAIKYLVGRVFILEMRAFDFLEFLSYRDSDYARLYLNNKIELVQPKPLEFALEQLKIFAAYYEEYALWGGYPAVVLAKTPEEKKEILKNIYNTYFLRDVKSILGLIDDYKLGKLIKALALQIGNLIEYNELSALSEFSVPTLKKYLNFLAKTYICDFAPPFYRNKRKEIVKNKKIYFCDSGLRNVVVNDFRALDSRPDAGNLLENTVWMQLTKRFYQVQFWRDKNKNEIDFIVDLGEGKIAALEIKNNQNKCRNAPSPFVKNYPHILTYCGYLIPANPPKKDINELFLPLI